jgi:hypothetical protein
MYFPAAERPAVNSMETKSRKPRDSTPRKRTDIGPQKAPDAGSRLSLDLPHGVERVFELNDNPDGGEYKGSDADDSGEDARRGPQTLVGAILGIFRSERPHFQRRNAAAFPAKPLLISPLQRPGNFVTMLDERKTLRRASLEGEVTSSHFSSGTNVVQRGLDRVVETTTYEPPISAFGQL